MHVSQAFSSFFVGREGKPVLRAKPALEERIICRAKSSGGGLL